jgi:hypothetical protein
LFVSCVYCIDLHSFPPLQIVQLASIHNITFTHKSVIQNSIISAALKIHTFFQSPHSQICTDSTTILFHIPNP